MNIFRYYKRIWKLRSRLLFLCMLILSFGGVLRVQAQLPLHPENLGGTGIDLDVTYISRTPRYNWDAVKQWPTVGETVTFTAQVMNKGTNASGSFSFQWLLDGQIIGSGTSGSIAPQSQAVFSRTWSWQAGRHSITFKADTQNQVTETAENNNLISDLTDALSVGFWVEQSVYNDFNSKQNGRGTYSWEDWAQYQLSTFNELLQRSKLPLAPQGVLTRLRLDKVVIVPDNTLASLNPQHAPIETVTDVQWGFAVQEYLNCPWEGCYDVSWNVHHELGHYLFGRVDLYALDVQGGDVDVRDANGNLVAGTPLLPYIAWDVVHYNSRTAVDLMASHLYDPMFLSDHTVYSLNQDWPMGQRTHQGWTYIYDIPADSKLKILDNNNQPIPNVQVSIYQAVDGDGSSGPYSQYFDNTPDISGTTNAQGIVSLGSMPFGNIQNHWGFTAGNILVKLHNPASGKTRYVWIEAIDFNLAYWRGEIATYTHVIHFPEGPKRLRLSQNQLTFSTVQGSSPIPQKIDISMIGEGVDKRWSVPDSTVPWLRTIPYANDLSDGFYPGPLSFIVDSADLPVGTYTAQVAVTADSGVLNSPQTITVALTVNPLNTDLYIGGVKQGSYYIPPHGSMRKSFVGVNSGPVKVINTENPAMKMIAAERVIYKVNGINTSFTEMMGLPTSQLDNVYWLPWYNNVDLDTQLRFANVSTTTATVRVYIGGKEKTSGCSGSSSPYTLAAGASLRVSCAGVNGGPVEIRSTQNLVAAERVIYKVNGVNTSFSEMMALPNKQLNTTYWLPWYNNKDLDTQLRFANVSGQPATVRIFIGGQEKTSGCMPSNSPFALAAGASLRVSCAGVNGGPVEIRSTQNLVAAERVIYKVNGVNTSFSEMMALPTSQLDGTYWLPWYNNKDLDTQLRFANVSGQPATVRIFIGGQEKTSGCTPSNSPYTLAAGASLRVSCPGVNNGPVEIRSTQHIVAAERVIYKVNNIATSFSEMMGLPNRLLDTIYWFPWYNNVDLDTQLRFGVP